MDPLTHILESEEFRLNQTINIFNQIGLMPKGERIYCSSCDELPVQEKGELCKECFEARENLRSAV